MYVRRSIVLLLSLVVCCTCSFAQTQRAGELLRHLSKEDRHEYLLYKSKLEKSKAITMAVAGPILCGTGLYLLNKKGPGNGLPDTSPTKLYGALLGSLGLTLSISSYTLFVAAGKTKKEARLVLTAHSATYLNRRLAVAGVQLIF
jgi:hypothetical protein